MRSACTCAVDDAPLLVFVCLLPAHALPPFVAQPAAAQQAAAIAPGQPAAAQERAACCGWRHAHAVGAGWSRGEGGKTKEGMHRPRPPQSRLAQMRVHAHTRRQATASLRHGAPQHDSCAARHHICTFCSGGAVTARPHALPPSAALRSVAAHAAVGRHEGHQRRGRSARAADGHGRRAELRRIGRAHLARERRADGARATRPV